MWEPWIGEIYRERRTLILGESCYDWDLNGVTHRPRPDHPQKVVKDAIDKLGDASTTMRKLTRAICRSESPKPEDAAKAWSRFAFTNYIPVSVGYGAAVRPSVEARALAAKEWAGLLDKLHPQTVIVLGKKLWSWMPPTQRQLSQNVEGYVLRDGTFAMCFAIPHPSRGPTWKEYASIITKVEAAGT